MNKNIFKIAAIVLVAGVTVLTGCKKDEDKAAPSVTLSNITGSELVLAATDVSKTVTFVVKAEAEIKTIVVSQKDKSGNGTTIPVTPADYAGKVDFTGNFTATGLSEANAPYTITVVVTDKDGVTATQNFTMKYPGTNPPVGTFTGSILPTATLGARNAAAGSYFNAVTGTVYTSGTQAANKANIDIVFDDLAGAKTLKLYSPKALGTDYKATKFGATSLVFADVKDADMTAITANDANIAIVAGGTYAFITEAGKKGLVKVNSITGTSTAATITIDVKVQK